MSLGVIGVGFGRTGTLSLKLALERLGFAPCEHITNLFDASARVDRWLEAVRRKAAGTPIDWSLLFDGYWATVDWPGAYFWRELVVAMPDVPVVLTVRDPDRWYASAAGTILRLDEPRAEDGSPLPLAPSQAVEKRPDAQRYDRTARSRRRISDGRQVTAEASARRRPRCRAAVRR